MRFVWLLILLLVPSSAWPQHFNDLIDYESLDHFIELADFRAGNHDPSGVNDYYFELNLFALAVLKEERKKEFKDRKQIRRSVGEFGKVKLKTLAFWKKTPNPPHIRIKGENLRDLASEAMRTLDLSESQVALLARVKLFERNKKFFILGEDTLIGATSYYIIPESVPHKPKVENATIEITDELGTHVKLKTKYDLLDPKKKKRK